MDSFLNSERQYYFDNAKFILIILVVLGHGMELVGGEWINSLYRLIYIFHMPCFVLVSGYFSKKYEKQTFIDNIIQYIVFQLAYNLFSFFVLKTELSIQFTTPFWLLWFSFAIIAWKSFLPQITKLKLPVSIIIFFVIGILVGYESTVNYYLSLSRIIVFFPLFIIGYYMNFDMIKRIKKLGVVIPCIVFTIVFILIRTKIVNIDVRIFYGSYSYKALGLNMWYSGLYRIVQYSATILLSICFFSIIPNKKTWYSILGTRTLQVYLLHGFVMKYLGFLRVGALTNTYILKLLFFVALIIMTIVLSTKPVEVMLTPITKPVRLFRKHLQSKQAV